MQAHPFHRTRLGGMGLLLAFCVSLASAVSSHAQNQGLGSMPGVTIDPISFRGPDPSRRFEDIEIQQNLNAQVPLDLEFVDESGETVRLADYVGDKPVLLSLVYYECPAICNEVLRGVANVLDASALSLEPGEDFHAVTVSIDPEETPELAAAKKGNYLERTSRDSLNEGWHWLTTTDQDAIDDLAQAVGFRYYYDPDTDQFAHAAGIMIITPDGIVSHYYMGLEFLPRNVELMLTQASNGEIGSLVDKLVLLCFTWDPAAGGYGLYVLGAVCVGGFLTILAIATFWFSGTLLRFTGRGKPNTPGKNDEAEDPGDAPASYAK